MNDYDVIVIRVECFYWACIPSKTVMLPGEAVRDRRPQKPNRTVVWRMG
jgi:hypothetical protein